MADLTQSVNPTPSPVRSDSQKSKEKAAPSKSKGKSSSALREAERRIKALEGQLEAAQRGTSLPPTPPGQTLGVRAPAPLLAEIRGSATEHDWSPERLSTSPWPGTSRQDQPGPSTSVWPHPQPTAASTFTPTAAGLRPTPESWGCIPPAIQEMLASAYSHGMAAGAQQAGPSQPPQPSLAHPTVSSLHRDVWMAPPSQSQLQDLFEEDPEMMEEMSEPEEGLSDDEGTLPEPPIFAGLFKPSLFRILLHKAKQVLAQDSTNKTAPETEPQPVMRVLSEPQREADHLPAFKLFLDNIKRPWESPAVALGPTTTEKKFYAFDPELENLLQFPPIDAPVANLVSTAVVPSEMADGLRPDDRRAENLIRKAHQMSAWALKAASAASFFNRASVVWLQEMLTKLGPEDGRLKQDINKILAAAEFSADATLSAVRFSSRALATNLSSRRLLWLRSWQADAKSKWRLASAPFDGAELFGKALDKVLVEDKDKKKSLPRSYRRQDRRSTPYFRRQPFRGEASSTASPASRSYSQGSYHQPYRTGRGAFTDRSRQYSQPRGAFRGSNKGGFRKKQ